MIRRFVIMGERAIFFAKSLIKIWKIKLDKNNFFLLGAPFHKNLGDHAQTYCAQEWIRHNYKDAKVYIFDTRSLLEFNKIALRILAKKISKKNLIFLHSGYHTTDLYPLELELEVSVTKLFPENKIVILPQTILFEDKDKQRQTAECFNNHGNIYFLCRDKQSFAVAKKIFSKTKLLLFPDIVTTIVGKNIYTAERSGVNLCLRNDSESLYGKQTKEIKNRLSVIGKVDLTDTESNLSALKIVNNLRKELEKTWNAFSRYKVTVTDRYHGTIFSIIAGTPVVVISSTDHKLESGVKWFADKCFKDFIYYANDIDDAIKKAKEFSQMDNNKQLPLYFVDKYYNSLKSRLSR